MSTDQSGGLRHQIGLRVSEIRERGPRSSPLDLHARMESIRQLAAEHGLAALEGLARGSAQMALLPGHRVSLQSCLERLDDALDSRSDGDRNTILAAVAVRPH